MGTGAVLVQLGHALLEYGLSKQKSGAAETRPTLGRLSTRFKLYENTLDQSSQVKTVKDQICFNLTSHFRSVCPLEETDEAETCWGSFISDLPLMITCTLQRVPCFYMCLCCTKSAFVFLRQISWSCSS